MTYFGRVSHPNNVFDNRIYATALMKSVCFGGTQNDPPLNCQKMMSLTQNHYITNNNWNLLDFLAGYVSLYVSLSTCLPVSLCLRDSVYISLSMSMCLYISMSQCLRVALSTCLSMCPTVDFDNMIHITTFMKIIGYW